MTEFEKIKNKYKRQIEKAGISDNELRTIIDVVPDSMIVHYEDMLEMDSLFSRKEIGDLIMNLIQYSLNGTSPEYEDKGLIVTWNKILKRMQYDQGNNRDRIIKNRINGRIPKDKSGDFP